MRDLLGYAKDRLDSSELKSNVALYRACVPLARLMQISRLVNVDDVDDVVDLISSSKRKGNWDLKLDDAKVILCLRREFSADKVNELLHDD
jgi:conserved oligomeric Golgi complex subunit 4